MCFFVCVIPSSNNLLSSMLCVRPYVLYCLCLPCRDLEGRRQREASMLFRRSCKPDLTASRISIWAPSLRLVARCSTFRLSHEFLLWSCSSVICKSGLLTRNYKNRKDLEIYLILKMRKDSKNDVTFPKTELVVEEGLELQSMGFVSHGFLLGLRQN